MGHKNKMPTGYWTVFLYAKRQYNCKTYILVNHLESFPMSIKNTDIINDPAAQDKISLERTDNTYCSMLRANGLSTERLAIKRGWQVEAIHGLSTVQSVAINRDLAERHHYYNRRIKPATLHFCLTLLLLNLLKGTYICSFICHR